jgi:hypothetical protein
VLLMVPHDSIITQEGRRLRWDYCKVEQTRTVDVHPLFLGGIIENL